MSSRNQAENKIAEAMASIEGIRRAEPAPWFFARVNARLKQSLNFWEKASGFISRPAIAFSTVAIVMAMNVLLMTKTPAERSNAQTDQLLTESESIVASSSSFDYENLGQ